MEADADVHDVAAIEPRDDGATSTNESTRLVFRLYAPRDEALRTHCVPQPTPLDAMALLEKFHTLDVHSLDDVEGDSVQISLAPKNPNWDLKRDLSKQLQVLEHQTQAAIIALVREKVAAQNRRQPQQQQQQQQQQHRDADANNDLMNEAIDTQAMRAEAAADSDTDD